LASFENRLDSTPISKRDCVRGDLGLDRKPEFRGAEAGERIRGIVVAFEKRVGAAEGEGPDYNTITKERGEKQIPHLHEGKRVRNDIR
jgi:hypothetical protein